MERERTMRGQTLGAGESLLVQVDSGILTEYVFEEVIPNLEPLVAIDVGDCVFDDVCGVQHPMR